MAGGAYLRTMPLIPQRKSIKPYSITRPDCLSYISTYISTYLHSNVFLTITNISAATTVFLPACWSK